MCVVNTNCLDFKSLYNLTLTINDFALFQIEISKRNRSRLCTQCYGRHNNGTVNVHASSAEAQYFIYNMHEVGQSISKKTFYDSYLYAKERVCFFNFVNKFGL